MGGRPLFLRSLSEADQLLTARSSPYGMLFNDRGGWIAVKLLCAYSSIKRTSRKRLSVNLCLPKCFGYNAQTPSMQLSQR